MVKQEFGPLPDRFIGQPAFKQVLLEHIALFGQQLFRAVGEDDANAFDIQRFHVVWKFEVKVLNGQLRKALSAMNRGADFRVGLDDEGGKAGSRSVKCRRTASWARPDDHDVVHAPSSSNKTRRWKPMKETVGEHAGLAEEWTPYGGSKARTLRVHRGLEDLEAVGESSRTAR